MPTPFAADSACGVKSALSRTLERVRNHGLDQREGAADGYTIGASSRRFDEQTGGVARSRRSLWDNAGAAPARPVRRRSIAWRADDGGGRRRLPGLLEESHRRRDGKLARPARRAIRTA